MLNITFKQVSFSHRLVNYRFKKRMKKNPNTFAPTNRYHTFILFIFLGFYEVMVVVFFVLFFFFSQHSNHVSSAELKKDLTTMFTSFLLQTKSSICKLYISNNTIQRKNVTVSLPSKLNE